MVALNRMLRKVGINAGPILFRKIHDTLGPKMRYLATGGSRFDPKIAQDFHDLGIDVLQALGLTETTAAIFVNSPARQRDRLLRQGDERASRVRSSIRNRRKTAGRRSVNWPCAAQW